MRYPLSTKGVSLIELLLYIAIFSGLMFVLIQVFITFSRDQGQIEARTEVNQSSRFAIETIVQAIHNSLGVTGPEPGASLTLSMPDSAKDPTVFDLSGGALRIQEGVSSAVNLTSGRTTVGSLTFTKITNSPTTGVTSVSIKIDITVNYNNETKPHLQYSKNTVTTAGIKN